MRFPPTHPFTAHRAARSVLLAVALTGGVAQAAHAAPGPLQLTGTGPGQLQGSAGDFNGDGIADTIYAYDGNVVSVLFGSSTVPVGIDPGFGVGTGAISFTVPSGSSFYGAAGAGDVDDDGLSDIIVVTDKLDYVVYGTRSGAGTKTALAAGPGVTTITPRPLSSTFGATTSQNADLPSDQTYGIGDFNGDGYDDLKVRGGAGASLVLGGPRVSTINTATASARVSQLDGPKVCGVYYVVYKQCQNLTVGDSAIGDVNGDGKADLFITGAGTKPQILLGRTGSFTLAAGAVAPQSVLLPFVDANAYVAPRVPSALGDVNGDGLDDAAFGSTVVLGRRTPPASIAAGDGTITIRSTKQAGARLAVVGVGDQNGDGRGDLLVFSAGDVPRLVTSLPAPGGSVDIDGQPSIAGLASGTGTAGVVARTDIDGDGAPDVLLSGDRGTSFLTHQAPPTGGGPVQATPFPTDLTTGGWLGNAPVVGSRVQLSRTGDSYLVQAWKAPNDWRRKTISFDVDMSAAPKGSGGEGMVAGFVPPNADGGFTIPQGTGGNTLGFGGFTNALGVALDVIKGTGDPAANEVGFTSGGAGENVLRWLATGDPRTPLYGGGTVHVKIVFKKTFGVIWIDGAPIVAVDQVPAPSSYLVFTAATTNAHYQETYVSNLVVSDS